jgi:hypothetical protein
MMACNEMNDGNEMAQFCFAECNGLRWMMVLEEM